MLATADGHPIADGFLSRVPAPTIAGIEQHPFYVGLINIWHQKRNPMSLVHAAYWDAKRMRVGWVIVWPSRLPRRDQRLPGAHRIQAALTSVGPVHVRSGVQVEGQRGPAVPAPGRITPCKVP